jgi:hypothetical protein
MSAMGRERTGGLAGRAGASTLQMPPQEGEGQCRHVGALRVVGGAAVAAFDVFPVQRRVALLEQRATILRAWPGCTRSSRVEVMKSIGGSFRPRGTLW